MQSLIVKSEVVPLDQVQTFLREHYGLDGTLHTLASEKDQLIHVRGRDRDALLKIANQAESPAESALQVNVLLHLSERAPTLPVQRVIKTLSGEPFVRMRWPGSASERNVRLVSYVPGVMLKQARRGVGQASAFGAMWAELGLALASFVEDAARQHSFWDLQWLGDRADWMDEIEDDERRRLVRAGYVRFQRHVAAELPALPSQVIHNDFSGDNVLVADDAPDRPAGILDFGDLVHSQRVNDIAVGAVDFLAADDPDMTASKAFVSGYAAKSVIDDREKAMLSDLIVARMVLRITIAEWRAKRFPENQGYLLRNMPMVRASLQRLLAIEPSRLRDVFAEAATGPHRS